MPVMDHMGSQDGSDEKTVPKHIFSLGGTCRITVIALWCRRLLLFHVLFSVQCWEMRSFLGRLYAVAGKTWGYTDEVYCSGNILHNVKVSQVPSADYFSLATNQSHEWDTDMTLTEGYAVHEGRCASDSGLGDSGRGSSGERFTRSALCLFEPPPPPSNGILHSWRPPAILSNVRMSYHV